MATIETAGTGLPPSNSPRRAAWPRLPAELWLKVLEHSDAADSPDRLVVLARGITKAPNPLSEAAQSFSLWRRWHPSRILAEYREQGRQVPGFLVSEFLRRHWAYRRSERADLKYLRNHPYREPNQNGNSFFQASNFSFQHALLWDKSNRPHIPNVNWEHRNPDFLFDAAVATEAFCPAEKNLDIGPLFPSALPASLAQEKEFLSGTLGRYPEWFSQLPSAMQEDADLRAVAFEGCFQHIAERGKFQHFDPLRNIPPQFFEDLPSMKRAIALQPMLFDRASEAIQNDPDIRRLAKGG